MVKPVGKVAKVMEQIGYYKILPIPTISPFNGYRGVFFHGVVRLSNVRLIPDKTNPNPTRN